jgi:signal transduction histidine kinase/ActR/RegA family two-component response regulator
MLLSTAGVESSICPTFADLWARLDDTAAAVLLADEALFQADLNSLATRLAAQPPWSDLPFIVLTRAGMAARRHMAELKLADKLGNVIFLERPLNIVSLISAVRLALRARRRQRQVHDYLAEQAGVAEREAARLEARVQEHTTALKETEQERQTIALALAQAQKMEAVGQLTGGLAHDFNNMLTGIAGNLELLQVRLAQGRIDQLGRYIDVAYQGAQRAAALTQRLLAFSRRQTLDSKPTDMNKLVGGMTELIRSTVGPGITIRTVPQQELWPTFCDPHQLENALLNLCINARDAMPEGGRLTIQTANTRLTPAQAVALPAAEPGDYATLCITDTGCGMPPEVIARAFDPFYTTKPLGQGTGLGLSMIYGFVRQSGGHVQINSKVGQGTTVQLYLPRHEGAEQASPGELRATLPAEAVGRGMALVVDDEPPVRMLISEVLADLGCAVEVAVDGPSALRSLRALEGVDLLVTDVGLPGGMNGRQLADAAREQRPGLKILFITGYADTILAGKGSLGTGMAVMTKPFAISDLAAKIRDMLTSDRPPES